MLRSSVRRLLLATLLALLGVGVLPEARADSVAYQVHLPWVRNDARYAFFVCGHPRALTASSPPGLYPPFVATFPRIRDQAPAFGVLTGDIVHSGTPVNWDAVDAELATLGAPVHYCVGNHDMSNRALFVSRYGPTFYTYTQGQGDLYIVLDSELDSTGITGEQFAMLRAALAQPNVRRVFVFVHRLLWVCAGTPYEALYSRLNLPGVYNLQNNFWTEVVPLLRSFGRPAYVFAGDVGISWALALFYQQDGNLHLIASGVGGAAEESYLTVSVEADAVHMEAHRLDGQPLARGRLEAYDLAYYRALTTP